MADRWWWMRWSGRVPHVSRFVRDVGIFVSASKSPTSRKNREKWGTRDPELRRAGLDAIELAEDFAGLDFESGLLQVIFHLRAVPEINGASGDFEPGFADCHAHGAGARPGREKSSFGQAANDFEARQGIGDVVPESDGDDKVED